MLTEMMATRGIEGRPSHLPAYYSAAVVGGSVLEALDESMDLMFFESSGIKGDADLERMAEKFGF